MLVLAVVAAEAELGRALGNFRKHRDYTEYVSTKLIRKRLHLFGSGVVENDGIIHQASQELRKDIGIGGRAAACVAAAKTLQRIDEVLGGC